MQNLYYFKEKEQNQMNFFNRQEALRKILASVNINSEQQKRQFLELLTIAGCFQKEFFSKTINYVKNLNKNINIPEINEAINKENFFSYFNNDKELLDWIIVVTQIKFFNRKQGEERWQTSLDNILKDNIDKIRPILQNIALSQQLDFKSNKYDYVVILGSTYVNMNNRLNTYIEKQNKIETKNLYVLVGSRLIDLKKFEIEGSVEELDELYLNKQDEVSATYQYIKNQFLQKNNLKEFDTTNLDIILQFKNELHLYKQTTLSEIETRATLIKNYKLKLIGEDELQKQKFENTKNPYLITETTMAKFITNQVNSINAIKIFDTHKMDNTAIRPNTNDTIAELLDSFSTNTNKEQKLQEIIQKLENNKFAFISSQPNALSQLEQTKDAIVEYCGKELTYEKMIKIFNNLEVVAKANPVQENNELTHIQTLGATLFANYSQLYNKLIDSNEEDRLNQFETRQEFKRDKLSFNSLQQILK